MGVLPTGACEVDGKPGWEFGSLHRTLCGSCYSQAIHFDDPELVDPKYWGKVGDVVTVGWDDHGATPEDPYYWVHVILDMEASAPEHVCATDMFWGEELQEERTRT